MGNRTLLLIRPPSVMKGTSFIATQFPLNLAYIAASLVRKGYDVGIWDFDVERFDEEGFKDRIVRTRPLAAGISCYTPTILNGHAIASRIKAVAPEVRTIVGGCHVSALPEGTMEEFPDFDIGVVGEGEDTLAQLAERLTHGTGFEDVAGLVYRKDGKICRSRSREPIKDLDSLPFPARGLLNHALYTGQAHRGFSRSFLKITEMMTSRGCPNRCIFCASDVTMRHGVRFGSADSVRREIAECVERYGFNHFVVSDDTFCLKEDRLYEICDEFARRKVTWNCNARVWPISRKMLDLMVRSGCEGITFGVESGSPRILKLVKKNASPEQIENAFRWSREAGVRLIEADIIIGSHPSETKEDIAMTKRLLKKISPDIVMVSVIVPYPGTELYTLMKERGLVSGRNSWDRYVLFGREPSWRTDNFSPRDLVRIQKRMLFDFYFRPGYAFKILRKIKNLKELSYWLRGGFDFLSSSAFKKR